MLEEIDLLKIKKAIKDEVDPLKRDLGTVKIDVKNIREEITPMRKDIKTIKSDMAKTRKDINMIIGAFDRGYLDLRQRVEIIEEKVGIS